MKSDRRCAVFFYFARILHSEFIVRVLFLLENKTRKEAEMFVQRNRNPMKKNVGDCVVRALSTVLDEDWDKVYLGIMAEGYAAKDIPTADYVWGNYLKKKGYYRSIIPNTCPNCYTVRDFCNDHPRGKYVLGTGTHAIAAIDGNWIDSWDSGDQVPIYYWKESDI